MAETLTFVVTEGLDGERVDKAVAGLLGISRSEAASVCRSGVLVDDVAAEPSDRVRTGQRIQCEPPIAEADIAAEEIDLEIIHEDDQIVVVNKPPGMVVHPGAGNREGTMVAALLHRYPDIRGVGQAGRWGLVHRLDRDTSGLLVVARTERAHHELSGAMRRREVGRQYLALVEGSMDAPTGTIEAPIGRDPSMPTRRSISPTGRHATTHYETVREVAAGSFTLISVRLETGRTHQIRVHLSAIGHPVAGDRLYGATHDVPGLNRTFLHAHRLDLRHPGHGGSVTFEAPLPNDLETTITALDEDAHDA